MANPFNALTRPAPGSDYRVPSPHRKTGLIIAAVGLGLTMVTRRRLLHSPMFAA